MGKYIKTQGDVFSIFGSEIWKSENIPTYPPNFIALNKADKYIRVSVIANGPGLNINSTSGVLIIDIFTPAGSGPNESMLIADRLDSYLAGKTITIGQASTQLFASSLGESKRDLANSNLSMTPYTIPFKHFGVSN